MECHAKRAKVALASAGATGGQVRGQVLLDQLGQERVGALVPNTMRDVVQRLAVPKRPRVWQPLPCDSELSHIFDWNDFNQVPKRLLIIQWLPGCDEVFQLQVFILDLREVLHGHLLQIVKLMIANQAESHEIG